MQSPDLAESIFYIRNGFSNKFHLEIAEGIITDIVLAPLIKIAT